MTKNDLFYKILFAIELALLPIVFCVNMFLDAWAVGLVVAGIAVTKIWLEVFKDKYNHTHTIIDSIGSISVFSTLLIFYYFNANLNLAFVVALIVFIVLNNLLTMGLFNRKMPEFIEAVDFCYIMFEVVALIALTFVAYYDIIAFIALFALLLASLVSGIYKVYYLFRYCGVVSAFKNMFKRK